MWEYTGTQNYFGSYNNYWKNLIPANPSPVTGPAPRSGAVTWTQPGAGGDLFLFGGQDHFANFYNEIWRYNIASNAWTQVGGSANQPGVYGTQGVAAAGNIPGARWGATSRIDASGNVWLFGGFGYDSAGTLDLLNDLWNYNITTNQWTWISGSKTVNQTGNYGIKGTPAGTNVPGARQASMAWLDGSGNFWLFGGFDLDSQGNPNALNDLWEFKTGVWTWVSGANVVNQTGVYGTQDVAAATNVPGARWSSAAWTDAGGNLWLFGGQGYDSTGNGSLNDLWEYKGGQWIWVKGPASVSQAGVYGTTSPGPIIYHTWATAQGRALLLAIGSTTRINSGSSADKASIPQEQTATACSATCGDTCLTPKPNGLQQKAACFASVKACGFCVPWADSMKASAPSTE